MTITSGLQASPSDCWSRSYQESGLSCLRSESFTLVVFVIGNYRKLQQWIYEFCYQLGMHLEFRDRRRILIGPNSALELSVHFSTQGGVYAFVRTTSTAGVVVRL